MAYNAPELSLIGAAQNLVLNSNSQVANKCFRNTLDVLPEDSDIVIGW